AAVAIHGRIPPPGIPRRLKIRGSEARQGNQQQGCHNHPATPPNPGESASRHKYPNGQDLEVIPRKEAESRRHAGEGNEQPYKPAATPGGGRGGGPRPPAGTTSAGANN